MENKTPEEKNKFNPNILRRKTFLVQKFINFLIILRVYLVQIPLWIWALLLVLLYALKLRRQGNIPSSLLVIIAMIFSVAGQLLQNNFMHLMAPIFAGLSHFLVFKVYWFPQVTNLVGMRQQILQNDVYMMELYPIKKNQNRQKRVIPWNYRIQMKRLLDYEAHKGAIYRVFMKFFISAINKVKIILAQGDQQPTNQVIVFSHGRGATPLMYSQTLTKLVSFQQNYYDIFAVQHTQVNITPQVQQQKIKRYRQIQVQVRATQMYSAFQHCKKKKIVLMGHSYGGSTTIQTYHCLSDQQKQKVSHIVLLDPWFFPLNQSKLKQQIKCPVLILANQYFLQNKDVYERNKQFLNAHKKDRIVYMVWKKGDHLHQTDMGFLIGNTFGRIKHSQLTLQMLNKNLKAIQMFITEKNIKEQKMIETFKQDLLPNDWKPQQWNNYLNL